MLIGIDLGTTNSLAACFRNGKVEIIPNRLGKKLTPSVVSVDDEGSILIGETAREYGYLHPERTAKVFKRTMGTDHEYDLAGMKFSSEELSGFVLRSLKEDAEVYLGEPVHEAIISVPAYFNDNQRKATKRAGELAGLTVSRIINEPTASAIAYGVGEEGTVERCMIFDLGGGTFDVTILEYFKNIMEVYAIAGDNFLGGEDFTQVLVEMYLQRLLVASVNLLDLRTLSNIYKAAEEAKCSFSDHDTVTMAVNVFGVLHEEQFTVAEYEEACRPLLEKLRKPIEKSLRDAKVTLDDLDRVILVGGATRLKIVRDYVKKVTGIYPDWYVDPDTSVAQGAALQCAMKERDRRIEEVILTDVCPFTLGTEVVRDNGAFEEPGHYLPIIERNTVIPVSRTQTVYTAHDNQKIVTVKVLQGESYMARNNLLLGSLTVEVPVGPKGQEAIEITYTYDVNSLLEVEVKVVSTGLQKKVIIQNEENKVSEEEARKRFERLQYLKQNPREEEENRLAMFRANRVYEESLGSDKDRIGEMIGEFDNALNNSTRLEVELTRKKLEDLLDEIENKGFTGLIS
ncbi:MAG: molecular chaperone HscC [Erysipelotrichaceae bacterium]|nr:molecular chaperone HscC [Erysipelotrichaceae bacterium]